MYAHANGECAVCVGVDFCYMLPDDYGQVLIVPCLYAGAEHCLYGCRVYLCVGGDSPGYNVFQFGLPGPQSVQLCFQFWDDQAGQDGLHAVADLGRHLGKLCTLCGQVGRCAVDLIGDILRRGGKICGRQVSLQMLHHERLYFISVDIFSVAGVCPVLVAAAVVPGDIALFVRAGMADVGAAAFFTFNQARQQVTVPGFIFCVPLVVAHSVLHRFPCVHINDCRDGTFEPYHIGVQLTACPFTQQLVFLFVPSVYTNIPFILQQAVQAVLPDGPPLFTAEVAQVIHNVVVAFAMGVPGENITNHGGLCGVDYIGTVYDVITKWRDAAQERAGLSLHGHAVNGLLPGAKNFGLAHANGEQFQQKVLAVGQVAQLLPCGGDHRNAQVHHGFSEAEPVANVAAAAGDVVDHNGVKHSRLGGPDHILEAAPVGVRSAGTFILERCHDLYVVGLAVFPDFLELVRDRVLCLAVGAVPRVFCRFQKIHFLFDCRYATIKGHKAPIF